MCVDDSILGIETTNGCSKNGLYIMLSIFPGIARVGYTEYYMLNS